MMKYYFIKGTGEGHSDSVIPEGRSKGRELSSYVRGGGGGVKALRPEGAWGQMQLQPLTEGSE